MQIEIKTTHGQTFIQEMSDYNAQAIADELNDPTGRKQNIAIGNVVLNRNFIASIAPVSSDAETTV